MPLPIIFNNVDYPAGQYAYVTDGGNGNFTNANESPFVITINGTINQVGDTVTASSEFGFSDTLTATQYDDSGSIVFSSSSSPGDFVVLSNNPIASNSSFSYSEQSIGDYVVCYCVGTLVLTPHGEVAVEDLRIGDIVVTASGKHRPIKWIGTRSYIGRFANANSNVLPVRFKAGSLADGIPARDLRVSPKHAMFLDGCLIPAASLVNGVSIVKEERVDELTYFHIELDSHDVLIAEGAASESFVDDNGRGIFHNAHTFAAMYPNEQRVEAVYCAPRVEHGFVLEAVRRRLNERAGLQAPAVSRFGELCGEIEGCDGTMVWGWAQDAAYPDAPVCLDVLVNSEVVGLVYADRATAEQGARGFTISLPGCLSNTASVSVRRSADGAMLGSIMPSASSIQAAA